MSTLIKLRRDTSTNWTAADPVLALGEAGIETDTLTWKVGDGTTAWNDLPYMTYGGGGASLPLANGTSNFNIATVSGNATVTAAGTTWTFGTDGNVTIPGDIIGLATIDIDNRATGNSADINLYAADDITIQARDRTFGSSSEGGDINIYAGDSAEDSDSSGGDVQIYAGDGGAANVDYGGSGGFITIQSGRGGDASTGVDNYSAEGGGALTLRAGDSGSNMGNVVRGATGGAVYIESGDSTGNTINGGGIVLTTGAAGGDALGGSVEITIPGSDLGPGGTWTFDGYGQINIPQGSNSFDEGRIQSANGYPTLLGYGSGEHGGPELDWMDGNDLTDLGNANVLRNTMYINDQGLYVGINENDVANVASPSWQFATDGTVVFPTLEVDLHNGGVQSAQTLQFGDPEQQVIITGPSPAPDNNAQRLIIQGQRGNGTGEGGDVYFWAGDSDLYGGDIKIYAGDADNVSAGYGGYVNIDGGAGFNSGGQVEITGGYSSSGDGGYVNLIGGQGNVGGDVGIEAGFSQAGPGGAVNITGGGSTNGQAEYGNVIVATGSKNWTFDNTGNLVLPSGTPSINYANGDPFSGGPVNTGNVTFDDVNIIGTGNLKLQPDPANSSAYLDIYLTTGPDIHIAGNGETVVLGTDAFANVTVNVDGNVFIQAGNAGGTQTWAFDTAGNITLPRGGVVYETNIPDGGLNGNTIALTPSGGSDADQQLLIYPTANDANHLHLTSGNLYNTELYLGSDDFYVKMANTGNIVVNSNDAVGNTAQWTFDTVGNITIPSEGSIQTAPGSNGNIFIHPDGNGGIFMQGSTNTLLRISSDIANTNNKIEVDTYGETNTLGGAFVGRFARGIPGAYVSVQQDDRLALFGGLGYGNTAFSGNARGRIAIDAAENWTDSAQGTHVSVWTTGIGVNSPAEIARFGAGGNFYLYAGNVLVGNGFVKTGTYTVGSLPSASVAGAGARAYVTDADSRTFDVVVSGGAGNAMPVWSDGTNWRIG